MASNVSPPWPPRLLPLHSPSLMPSTTLSGKTPQPSPYRSFWMGGFEGADHLNQRGRPLDMSRASGHAHQLDSDYARLARLGLHSARESVGWRLSEPQGQAGGFDFSRAQRVAAAAAAHGVQPIWTLMHYGTPSDVDLRSDAFIPRFVRYAAAAAQALQSSAGEAPVYNLINEIGFLSWAVAETSLIHPYNAGRDEMAGSTERSGFEIKRRLVRAVLQGMDAIRAEDPRARFLHVEPLVHVVAPQRRPKLARLAAKVRGFQWQVWDMLAGRLEPELGGSEAALDLIGVNHYHNGQWEVTTERRLEWHLRDPRRRPFAQLLQAAARRYGRPLMVAETSHFGAGRGTWLAEITAEVAAARRAGVQVDGLCLYPVVDRPDWNDPAHWHHSGLWDVVPAGPLGDAAASPLLPRRLNFAYAKALRRCQRVLPEATVRRDAVEATPAVASSR